MDRRRGVRRSDGKDAVQLDLIRLEDRTNPAGVWSQDGIVHSTLLRNYVPFDGYTGPIETAAVAGHLIAASAVNRVQVRDNNGKVVFDNFAFEEEWNGGVNVGFADFDQDGDYDLFVGAGKGGGPRLKRYVNDGNNHFTQDTDRFVFEPSFRGGVRVDGYGTRVAVFPGVGGGPVAEIDGQMILLGANPYVRGITDYAFADGNYDNIPEFTLLVGRNLATFDLQGNQTHAATTETDYSRIRGGDLWFSLRNALYASSGTLGIDQLDQATGFYQWSRDDERTALVGTAYEPNPRQGSSPYVPIDLQWPQRNPSIPGPGTSVGDGTGTGTFTAVVRDNTTNQLVGITNRHVSETIVYAPGLADTQKAVVLGNVIRHGEYGYADYSVFTLDRPVTTQFMLSHYNRHTRDFSIRYVDVVGTTELLTGDLVYKSGRTSGLIRGIVTDTNATSSVQYRNGTVVTYYGQNEIYGFNVPFSSPGDSGSPVLVNRNGQWLLGAQLFAGGGFTTIANDINRIFNDANVRLP